MPLQFVSDKKIETPNINDTIYVFDVPIENNKEIYDLIRKKMIPRFYFGYGPERIRKSDITVIEKLLGRKCHSPSKGAFLNND